MANFNTQDVETMISAQRKFFFSGATKSLAFRKEQLKKLKVAIVSHEKEILQALHKDLRKSEFEAYSTEVGIVLDSISYMQKYLEEWLQPVSVPTPLHFQPGKSFIVREPYGTVLIIGPFNYPFQLVMEPLIGAIIGGNTAIVKPSEASVHTAEIIKKIIQETFQENYVRIVEGEKEETTALIHASFDYIFFTGSVAVGKIIAKAAAERLTPHTLELGGKSPAIVDQTANLEVAVKRIAWGKFTNAGQTCVAPDYVLVHESVKVPFIRILKKTLQKFYGKDAQDSPDYGRIINERQFDRLQSIIEREQSQVLFGGNYDRDDLYIEPTVLQNITWNSSSMEDELFGPILPIIVYDDLRVAIQQIRQYPKPLAAYFFSETEKAIQYFLDELPFGGGCVNDTVTHVASVYLPFGGVGNSGVNAYHGKASFECFTHPKSILKKSTKLANNLLFPPYKQKVKLVKTILR
ncbi:aldehyde dehydrogenase [Viridibacillus sp. FSL R5-0477]|uniref:Aldehyde dehydrogenase n=1 Tax=Viridibacillus arenosi FSL R5-213 TaxID=1227360 RepID=W4F0Q2_9BACL|nr:aldehyde dehydrogenase [Viridibacillus arenosi]ETT85646.1 aldehyde dehydrogenase [Viridibacillus arenosi FSL R5-213]OMC93638.1 aldehyde dehydrogenase [Viridibacillus arenosi]